MRTLAVFLILILTTASVLAADGPRRVTIEDALAIKSIGAPRLSLDGKSVAYTQSEWDRDKNRRVSHIYLVPADGGASRKLTNGEKGESAPEWSPDGARIAFLADRGSAPEPAEGSGARRGGAQIWIIPIDGGEAEKLTSEENAVSGFCWSPDGKRIAYVTRDEHKDKADREKKKKEKFDAVLVEKGYLYSHLWVIELDNKKKKRLTEGEFSVASPQWSPDGRWIAYTHLRSGSTESSYADISEDRNADIYVVSAAGGAPVPLTTSPGSETVPRWSPDSTEIAFLSRPDPKAWAGKTDLQVMPAGGGVSRNLTRDFPESAGEPKWTGDGRALYFITGAGAHSHVFRVPAAGGRVEQATKGDRSYGQIDLSADRLAYLATERRKPADIWVAPISAGSARQVTHANPQIEEFALGDTEVIRWKGPDNFDVEGILIKPVGSEAGKRYPLVLQIHGGPYGKFDAGFNARAQIFAGKGYALLMPNPRGSTGYGSRFTLANLGDWGGKDFQDIMAGVDAVIARGIADPEKLVVMGGSYGGFMTFWTVTQTDRFKAAIGHAGISDWYSFHGQSDIPGLMEYGMTGFPWTTTDVYRRSSPQTYVDRVKTPLMITHGEQDRRVPIAQAEEFYRALKKRGVEVVFVRYPREGHGITEPNHQIDLVGRQLEWFDSHLRNQSNLR